MILGKVIRFICGWLITAAGVGLGVWHGRRLLQQGITGENYYQKNKISPLFVVRIVFLAGIVIGGLIWLDKKFWIFEWLATYAGQFSVVTMRTLLFFLFSLQWIIWEDKTKLKRSIPILAIAIAVMIGIEIFVLWPAALLAGHEIAPDGTIIQSTRTTCAPSSLANILRLYGQPGYERDVALKMQIGMNGTSDEESVKGARLLGFPDAKTARATLEEIASADLPMMLTIESCGVAHEVGLVGLTPRIIVIADPYVGLVHYTWKDFRKVYQERGIALGAPSFKVDEPVKLSGFNAEKFRLRSLSFEKTGN